VLARYSERASETVFRPLALEVDMVRSRQAAVLVLAAVAFATPAWAQFAAADLVYVPGVAHTPGVGDTAWRSDIYITSAEEEVDVDVAIVFLATGQVSNANRFFDRATWLGGREEDGWGKINPALKDIPPGGTVVLRDIVGEYWADDAGVANSGAIAIFAWESGTLQEDSTRVQRNIIVNSRVFTRSTFYRPDTANEGQFLEVSGTYGQTMPGVPWYNLADPSAFDEERDFSFMLLSGAAQDEDFRYNLGILNASDPLTSISIAVQPFRGTGEPFLDTDGRPIFRQFTLPPVSHVQFNDALLTLFNFASAPDDVLLKVSFISWSSTNSMPVVGMTVYGTMIDNDTNDPTAVLPAFAHPYNIECQWPPSGDGSSKAAPGMPGVSRRPLEIPNH